MAPEIYIEICLITLSSIIRTGGFLRRYKFMDNNKSNIGYKLGQIAACVIFACVLAIVIAGTAKVIIWMF